jgi:hypothetical protein
LKKSRKVEPSSFLVSFQPSLEVPAVEALESQSVPEHGSNILDFAGVALVALAVVVEVIFAVVLVVFAAVSLEAASVVFAAVSLEAASVVAAAVVFTLVEAGVAVGESSSQPSSSDPSSSDPPSVVDWVAAAVEAPELPEEDPKDHVTSTEISQYMESEDGHDTTYGHPHQGNHR